MRKLILIFMLIMLLPQLALCEDAGKTAGPPEKLTKKQAAKIYNDLCDKFINNGLQELLFGSGLPTTRTFETDGIVFLPTKSEKFKTMADLEKALKEVFSEEYTNKLLSPQNMIYPNTYKESDGKLYCRHMGPLLLDDLTYLNGDSFSLEQDQGWVGLKFQNDDVALLVWENGGWRFDNHSRISGFTGLEPDEVPEYIYTDYGDCSMNCIAAKESFHNGFYSVHYDDDGYLIHSMIYHWEPNNWEAKVSPECLESGATAAKLISYGPVEQFTDDKGGELPVFFKNIANSNFWGEYETLLKGDWAFLLVPRHKKDRIAIYSIDDKGKRMEKLKTVVGKPVFIFSTELIGNNRRPNMQVRLTTDKGKNYEFYLMPGTMRDKSELGCEQSCFPPALPFLIAYYPVSWYYPVKLTQKAL